MGRTYRTHERDDKCIKILVGKLEGKKPLGRPRSRREDKIILK